MTRQGAQRGTSRLIPHNSAQDEGVNPRACPDAEREGHVIEAVDAAGIDREVRRVARRDPAGVHKERIIEEWIERADGEQGGWQPAQIGVERRNIRFAPALRWDEQVGEPLARLGVEAEIPRSPAPHTGREGEVIQPRFEIRAEETRVAVPIPHSQHGHRREVRTRRDAADDDSICPEFALRMFGEPDGGGLAVVRPGWIGMLRGEAIIHADDRNIAGAGDALQHPVLLVRTPLHPPAAVDVEVDARDVFRHEDAQREFTRRARDGAHGRQVGEDQGPPHPQPRLAQRARDFDRLGV